MYRLHHLCFSYDWLKNWNSFFVKTCGEQLIVYRALVLHTIYTRNNMGQKCEGNCGLWVRNEIIFKKNSENMKKLWEPIGSYLLNSTANPAQFELKWAGLAVLFSRLFPNGSHDFFHIFRIFILNEFIKNPQTRNARAFLPLNISPVGSVL